MGACLGACYGACHCSTSYEIHVEIDSPSTVVSTLFGQTPSVKLTVFVNNKVIPQSHLENFVRILRQSLGIQWSKLKTHRNGSVTISSKDFVMEKLGHYKKTAQGIMEDLIRKGYPHNTACLV